MDRFKNTPIIPLIIGVIGISLSSILVKYSTAPSALTAAYRLLWTVLLMTPSMLGNPETRKKLKSTGKRSLILSAVSGFFLAIHFTTWFESLRFTTVASSVIITCTEAIWVALGFVFFLKGKMSRNATLAMIVAFLGSVLIALSDASAGKGSLWGDALALIAAIAVAAYTLLGRVVREETDNSVYTYVCYVCCSAVLLLVVIVKGYAFFGYGIRSLLCGLGLAVFSTILGHSIFSWCLKYFSPAFVSASKLCEPVLSSILAVFLFGEIPVLLQIIGGIIVLAGVIWYSRIELKAST